MLSNIEEQMGQIQKYFPNLYLEKGITKIVVKGELDFCARYVQKTRGKKQEYEIEYNSSHRDALQDFYNIEIHQSTSGERKVYEVGGRIKALASKKNISWIDMHLYKDGSCCLGRFLPRANETMFEFVFRKVFPYFVWQAYYEKYDIKPPCDEWGHGAEGELQYLSQLAILEENDLCPCASGKKIKKCCGMEAIERHIKEISQRLTNRLLLALRRTYLTFPLKPDLRDSLGCPANNAGG